MKEEERRSCCREKTDVTEKGKRRRRSQRGMTAEQIGNAGWNFKYQEFFYKKGGVLLL